jgi:lipid A 3-O-deacylase
MKNVSQLFTHGLFALLPVTLTLSTHAFGTETELSENNESPWQMVFQMDNDLFLGSDRNYTNGIRLGFVKELGKGTGFNRLLQKQLYALSGADEHSSFFRWRLRNRENLRFASGFGLTQLMFTPNDSKAKTAPKGQRPYAGWLGLEFSLHAKNDDQVSSVTFSIGTTGNSSLAEKSQKWVHENISGSPVYQGWDSQIPVQQTLNFHFDHKQRIVPLERVIGLIQFDGYYEWGAAVGNFQTNAYGGALIRVGYNLPATHSTPRVQLGSYGHELFRAANPQDKPFSILAFFGARTTAVMHDITLDGPQFSNFDTGVESKHLVGELVAGFGIRYLFVDLSYSQTLHSDEFYTQNRNLQFGSVMLRLQSLF